MKQTGNDTMRVKYVARTRMIESLNTKRAIFVCTYTHATCIHEQTQHRQTNTYVIVYTYIYIYEELKLDIGV